MFLRIFVKILENLGFYNFFQQPWFERMIFQIPEVFFSSYLVSW